jgi:RimJ/RimL family protein N-acetyltransferase
LKREDSELLREWRNSPKIAQFMEYREYITPEMQQAWFDSVNNNNNLYFIIELSGNKIGLFNAKNIDWEGKTFEAGVFFWDDTLWNSETPLKVVITFADFGFRFIKDFTIYARILKSNHRAIRFNTQLGFELCDNQEDIENQLYKATSESYFQKAYKLRKAFYSLVDNSPVKILFEPEDFQSNLISHFEPFIDREAIKSISVTESGKEYTLEI